MTQYLQFWFGTINLEIADFAGGPHGLEGARNDLGRASAAHVIGSFRFQQLGVGEDDAELVVQAMKQGTEFW